MDKKHDMGISYHCPFDYIGTNNKCNYTCIKSMKYLKKIIDFNRTMLLLVSSNLVKIILTNIIIVSK